MGIPGLWSELEPAAVDQPLPSLSYDALRTNTNHLRSLRIGIDASLWLFHAQQSTGGSNPFLRILFFRLARLLSLPILPLFVFDGPKRPSWKRGKHVAGRQRAIERDFMAIIAAFGFLHRVAPGEAEAELAWLDQQDCIDAVMTDDVDALVFGARTVIRNWGKKLSGTIARSKRAQQQAAIGDSSEFDADPDFPPSQLPPSSQAASTNEPKVTGTLKDHIVTVYKSWDVANMPELCVSREGLILIALLAGGDYDAQGLMRCGVKIALALAQAGFGDRLVEAFRRSYTSLDVSKRCGRFDAFLTGWCEDLREELKTDSRGFLGRRQPKLAKSVANFASTEALRQVLAYYVWPLTTGSVKSTTASSSAGRTGSSRLRGRDADLPELRWSQPNLESLVQCAQRFFEWSPSTVLARFRSTIWSGLVFRQLRQEVLELCGQGGDEEEEEGDGFGPWAELVESPASKAVRHYVQNGGGITVRSRSPPRSDTSIASLPAERAKQGTKKTSSSSSKALHDSPQATRITHFFSKTTLSSSSNKPRSSASGPLEQEEESSTSTLPRLMTLPPQPGDLTVLSISRRRRHVAMGDHVECRALIDVREMVSAVSRWSDDSIGQTPGFDDDDAVGEGQDAPTSALTSPIEEEEEEEDEIPSTQRQRKLVNPEEPMLLWLVESLLEQGRSGRAALQAFRDRQAAAERDKQAKMARTKKKTSAATSASSRGRGAAVRPGGGVGQRTIEQFMKGGAKMRSLIPSASVAADVAVVADVAGAGKGKKPPSSSPIKKAGDLTQQLDELQHRLTSPFSGFNKPAKSSRRPLQPQPTPDTAPAPASGVTISPELDKGSSAVGDGSTDSIEFLGMTQRSPLSRARAGVEVTWRGKEVNHTSPSKRRAERSTSTSTSGSGSGNGSDVPHPSSRRVDTAAPAAAPPPFEGEKGRSPRKTRRRDGIPVSPSSPPPSSAKRTGGKAGKGREGTPSSKALAELLSSDSTTSSSSSDSDEDDDNGDGRHGEKLARRPLLHAFLAQSRRHQPVVAVKMATEGSNSSSTGPSSTAAVRGKGRVSAAITISDDSDA